MKEDDPAKRWIRIISICTVLLILSISTVDAMKPVTVNEVIGVKCVVKKVDEKYSIIKGWFLPGISGKYVYTYHEWINYCPYCHKYDCLSLNPKGQVEKEATCMICDSDYDLVTGLDKSYQHSLKLKKA